MKMYTAIYLNAALISKEKRKIIYIQINLVTKRLADYKEISSSDLVHCTDDQKKSITIFLEGNLDCDIIYAFISMCDVRALVHWSRHVHR